MIRLMTDAAGRLEIGFGDGSEDGFLRVAAFLEASLGAERVAKLSGPGQEWWDYRVDGVPLTLHHDDMAGNVLFNADEPGRATIQRVFPVLMEAAVDPAGPE